MEEDDGDGGGHAKATLPHSAEAAGAMATFFPQRQEPATIEW